MDAILFMCCSVNGSDKCPQTGTQELERRRDLPSPQSKLDMKLVSRLLLLLLLCSVLQSVLGYFLRNFVPPSDNKRLAILPGKLMTECYGAASAQSQGVSMA